MRNWTALKERYLRDNLPTRLGNLASNLARIKSRSQNPVYDELVKSLVEESRYFIEWTAKEMEIDTAAELLDLQRILTRWLFHWDSIWSNIAERTQLTDIAGTWSERVLDMSGLLSAPKS